MSQNANDILLRVRELINLKTDKELCNLLEIKHNTLSSWKKRNTLDFPKVIALCEEKNLNLNYVFFGVKEKPPVPVKKPAEKKLKKIKQLQLQNSNRNLVLFRQSDAVNDKGLKEETEDIFVGQRVLINKLKAGTEYTFSLKSNLNVTGVFQEMEAEHIVIVTGTDSKENLSKIAISDIISIWNLIDKFSVEIPVVVT